jgi:hypothetical protein
MPPRQTKPRKAAGARVRSGAKKVPSRKSAVAAAQQRSSVIMQARIDGDLARTLLEQDAAVLGLDGPSDLVREGLRLVHLQAQEQAMADSYDAFYDGKTAPLPVGVASPGK